MTAAATLSRPTRHAARSQLSGEAGRWLAIAVLIVFDLIGFQVADITPVWSSAEPVGELALVLFCYGQVCELVRRYTDRYPTAQRFAAFCADLCLSIVQLGLFVLASAPLTYILARLNMPLVDPELRVADHTIGFDWTAVNNWVMENHAVFGVLRWAYFSHIKQSWILLVLGSLLLPGRRNGEFIWSFIISLVMCCAVSALIPALAMGGEVGSYVPTLKALRAGVPMTLDWNRLDGIVSFPSFHAALGVIYINAARHRLWTLIPFGILDILLIIATSPMGGHYLSDVIGGIAVALISIALARRLQSASPSASDSRLALPPAAVVSTETTRSAAKRAR